MPMKRMPNFRLSIALLKWPIRSMYHCTLVYGGSFKFDFGVPCDQSKRTDFELTEVFSAKHFGR